MFLGFKYLSVPLNNFPKSKRNLIQKNMLICPFFLKGDQRLDNKEFVVFFYWFGVVFMFIMKFLQHSDLYFTMGI